MKYDTLDGPLGETLMNLEEDDEPQTIDNLEKELTPNDRLDVITEQDEQDIPLQVSYTSLTRAIQRDILDIIFIF